MDHLWRKEEKQLSKGPWNPPSNPLLLLSHLFGEKAAHESKLAIIDNHIADVFRTVATKEAGAKAPPTPPTQAQGDDQVLQHLAAAD